MRSILACLMRLSVVVIALLATSVLVPPVGAGADSSRELRARDDCDPATFNAALGAGACIGNGNTTVTEFNNELAQRGSVNAWKYDPDHRNVNRGDSVVVVNRGGETHTFTKVARFGGGFVASLNQASGNPTPAPECATMAADGSLVPTPPSATNLRVAAQTQVPAPPLATGTTLFQCCIHPWMRIQVTQR
ncbi:MAG: hypothetical protein V7637_2741 [Mycobacteriales bacterium]|jgi:plastocyanin